MSGIAAQLEFDGELLVPVANIPVYRQLVSVEGWLRRIALAAWMGQYGEDWTPRVETSLRTRLTRRAERSHGLLYLGAESAAELIWQTTHGELMRLLAAEDAAVKDLTGYDSAFLQQKLDEVREIRNLLAHNRALSERTYRILQGLLASLEQGIDKFKNQLLYWHDGTILHDDDGWVGSWLATLLEGNDWSRFQAFVMRSGKFLEYVNLPGDSSDTAFPDARVLLHVLAAQLDRIVAICVNKSGSEFGIVTPVALDEDSQAAVCKAFARNPAVWALTPFEQQEPRFICHPKIWFYENESPYGRVGEEYF
jgi:hypothetical protein